MCVRELERERVCVRELERERVCECVFVGGCGLRSFHRFVLFIWDLPRVMALTHTHTHRGTHRVVLLHT